jgi:hypothetical protein
MSGSGRWRHKRDLTRRSAVRTASETFLIVTEGKTERAYFEGLRVRLGLATIEVKVVDPDVTDPMGLVSKAKDLRSKRAQDVQTDSTLVPFDNAWVVFDLEAPHGPRRPQAASAIDHAHTANVDCAPSDPSFEYWLILHHEFTTKLFASARTAEQHLRENHMPSYSKGGKLPDSLFERVPVAVQNAAKCRNHRRSTDGTNPSTDVDLLVSRLDGCAPVDSSLLRP